MIKTPMTSTWSPTKAKTFLFEARKLEPESPFLVTIGGVIKRGAALGTWVPAGERRLRINY